MIKLKNIYFREISSVLVDWIKKSNPANVQIEAVYIIIMVYTTSKLQLIKKSNGKNNARQRVSTDIVWIHGHITKTITPYFLSNAQICSMLHILASIAK